MLQLVDWERTNNQARAFKVPAYRRRRQGQQMSGNHRSSFSSRHIARSKNKTV